jgi:hypothetical protein
VIYLISGQTGKLVQKEQFLSCGFVFKTIVCCYNVTGRHCTLALVFFSVEKSQKCAQKLKKTQKTTTTTKKQLKSFK